MVTNIKKEVVQTHLVVRIALTYTYIKLKSEHFAELLWRFELSNQT